jgi:glycerol kinase
MAANDWFCQFLADAVDAPVERPAEIETTARGAAFLAGLATGVWPGLEAIARTWSAGSLFTPAMPAARRVELLAGWRTALRRALLT